MKRFALSMVVSADVDLKRAMGPQPLAQVALPHSPSASLYPIALGSSYLWIKRWTLTRTFLSPSQHSTAQPCPISTPSTYSNQAQAEAFRSACFYLESSFACVSVPHRLVKSFLLLPRQSSASR